MASSKKRRASTPPSAATTCPSSSINAAQTASPSLPYFLPELIPFIASRLTTLQDFFALRAACRTYRDLLPPSPANLASQGPLLLFRRLSSASGALFHVPLRRILRFRLPPTDPSGLTEFYSFGCRVAIQDRDGHDIDARRELRIRHLLTGERARLPDSLEPRYSEEGVVFSGDLVVTFRKQCRVLYYCHIGDLHWREARCDKGHLLYDLMFVKGTLYALIYNHPHYRLAVVELDKSSVGEQRIMDLRFGSCQAFADAVQWGIITVQRFSSKSRRMGTPTPLAMLWCLRWLDKDVWASEY
ncbi:hypothetical protein ZWY2020_026745 [Hordeum vulgare]|nr:hypothetical protein ZWY2020_026745 [Hordeum vulgare]